MNYIEETNEQAYREFEKILNDFRNGATYSDSIEKCQAFLLTSLNGLIGQILNNIPKLSRLDECQCGEPENCKWTKGYNSGIVEAKWQLDEFKKFLEQIKFNPKGR